MVCDFSPSLFKLKRAILLLDKIGIRIWKQLPHMKLKFFLWTKLLENLLLVNYLIYVTATLMSLCNILSNNSWFNASFELLMWITYFCSSCKLFKSFSTLSVFIFFQAKNINHCKGHVIFQDIVHQLSRKYPSSLSSLQLSLKSLLNCDMF